MINVTATIILGNSDNRLTQQDWASFTGETYALTHEFESTCEVHFSGAAYGTSRYQNYAVVVVFHSRQSLLAFRKALADVRARYNQESVAWIEGTTEFI